MSELDGQSDDYRAPDSGNPLTDTRGAVLLEYSILVGTVALACSVGLLVVGIAVLNSFGFVRELLLSAIP